MRKYSKMLIFVMLTLVLMAGSAFAGTISFTGAVNAINAPFTVALEAMGAARNLTQSGVTAANIAGVGGNNIAAIRILPGQALASGSLLTVTFANAAFDGSQVFLCEYDATNNGQSILLAPLSAPTSTVNSATQSFVISRATGGSNYVVMTTGANTANCANISGAFIYRLQPVTSAAMASVAYNAVLSGTVYDSASATNFANISASFATAYGASNSTIDFSNSSTSNGAHFINTVGANSASNASANIVLTAKNVTANSAGTTNAGLTVSALLSLQDSASWQGISRVYVDATGGGANSCTLSSNNAIATTLSGTVNLASGLFTGAATHGTAVCVDVTGNVALVARTIKAAWNISVGSGGVSPGLDTYNNLETWTPNGYQGIIPYISASSTYSTLCFIDNKSTMSAPVTIDIVTTESGATLTSLTGLSAGSVAAGKTMRVDIDSSIHPYTYSGTTETAGTTIPLTGVQSNDRLSAMINVGAAPAQVIVNCLQLDPSGSKRAVPVLTQADGAALPWQQ